MIQYTCRIGNETWDEYIEALEHTEKYSILEIVYNGHLIKLFLWHFNDEYWVGIPEMNIIRTLAYPTDEFWNWETLSRATNDAYFSKTIAVGISKYYSSITNTTNVVEYIKNLKGNKVTYKTSVVMYDPETNLEHLIYMINRKANSCEMLSISLKTKGDYSVSDYFITQLNRLYNQCTIEPNSPYLNKDIRHIIKTLVKK